MARLTLDEFRERFEEFEEINDRLIEDLIDEAYSITGINRFTVKYCTAHLVALEENLYGETTGGTGVITSERLGPKQTQYKTLADKDARKAFFATTPYGERVLALEMRSARAALGVMVA